MSVIRMSIFFLCSFFHFLAIQALPEHIIIREATQEDLPKIYACDEAVTYEHFLSVYKAGYAHLPIGKNAEQYVAVELADDIEWLPQCIEREDLKLLIAYDTQLDVVAGFAVGEPITPTTFEVDLLFVLDSYRKLGIGKALLVELIALFPQAESCELYALKFANEKTLVFYQRFGFINNGTPSADRIAPHGVPYSDLYYHLASTIPRHHS